MVWAQARGGAIGRDNAIPWRVPEDMAHFREVTGDAPVIMGRRTWESLPPRFRPLPGRRNIVVTRNADFDAPGADVVESVSEALEFVGAGPVSIIGGGEIYRAALPFATSLRLTEIDIDVADADAFAPDIDAESWLIEHDGEWLTSTAGPRYRFVDYVRRP